MLNVNISLVAFFFMEAIKSFFFLGEKILIFLFLGLLLHEVPQLGEVKLLSNGPSYQVSRGSLGIVA